MNLFSLEVVEGPRFLPGGAQLLAEIRGGVQAMLMQPEALRQDLLLRVNRERFEAVIELPEGVETLTIDGVTVVWDESADPWTVETKRR